MAAENIDSVIRGLFHEMINYSVEKFKEKDYAAGYNTYDLMIGLFYNAEKKYELDNIAIRINQEIIIPYLHKNSLDMPSFVRE